MQKSTSVYLSDEIQAKCKRLGVPTSRVCQSALEEYCEAMEDGAPVDRAVRLLSKANMLIEQASTIMVEQVPAPKKRGARAG